MTDSKSGVEATYKSQDTEEWLDIHFTRPIGYLWAKFFDHFGVHPNVITILSMIIGIAAGVMFYSRDLLYNVIGVLLLMWANFYDSADGQLARMTNQKTRWGRILDGFAGDTWFYTIYVAICLRLMPQNIPFTQQPWSWYIFFLAAIAGLVCHTRQSRLADYYRNIHLFFLKGDSGSELDNSKQQRRLLGETPRKGNFWWRAFLWGYANYTAAQEKETPHFQKLMAYLQEHHNGTLPEGDRTDFLNNSRPLMKYANFLTFNARAITLYIACIIDMPWIYFVAEITVFTLVYTYMRYKHERLCNRMLSQLTKTEKKQI